MDDHLKLANHNMISTLEAEIIPDDVGDAVVLMGGGQDSQAALLSFLRQTDPVRTKNIVIRPVYFDYGQLTFAPEVACCEEQLKALADHYGEVINIQPMAYFRDPMTDFLKAEGHAMVGGTNGFAPGAHAIELRNLRFLAIAAAFGAHHKAKWLVIGASPVSLVDNGYMATLATQLALTQNTMDPKLAMRVYAPLVMVHRSRVVQYLNENSPPEFERANFSCYTPVVTKPFRSKETYLDKDDDSVPLAGEYVAPVRYTPCGTCPSCTWRAVGHRLAGVSDPRPYVEVCN